MGLRIPPATIALLCVANLGALLFDLALLVDWIRNWRHVKVYWVYGLGAGLGALGLGILGVAAGVLTALPAWNALATPTGWESSATPSGLEAFILLFIGLLFILLGLLIPIISATKLAGFTMLGMHHAAALGHPSFPLLQRPYRPAQPATARPAPPAAGDAGPAWPAAPIGAPLSPAASVALPLPRARAARPGASSPRRPPACAGPAAAMPSALSVSLWSPSSTRWSCSASLRRAWRRCFRACQGTTPRQSAHSPQQPSS